MKDHLQATGMPEAARENRVRLEEGESPAAEDVFGGWRRLYRESSARLSGELASAWPDVPFDQLQDDERDPEALVRFIGQQTGVEEEDVEGRLDELFTDRSEDAD